MIGLFDDIEATDTGKMIALVSVIVMLVAMVSFVIVVWL